MRVLLIEPNKVLGKDYKRALEASGHAVVLCPGAQSAIHAADQEKPDVVVLEMEIAANNGVEFLYEFRSYPEWDDVPVIVLSMVVQQDIAGAGTALEKLGVASYLYKPSAKLSTLVTAVERQTPITS